MKRGTSSEMSTGTLSDGTVVRFYGLTVGAGEALCSGT